MKNSKSWIFGVVALVLLFAGSFIAGLVGDKTESVYGGMSNLDGLTIVPVESSDGLVIGSTGSTLTKIITGTCNLVGPANNDNIIAFGVSTTSCAVSGVVTSGDKVFATLNTTAGYPAHIVAAYASSTAGAVTVVIRNATSTPVQVSALGSSTQLLIVR